jgi:hypothetical protein
MTCATLKGACVPIFSSHLQGSHKFACLPLPAARLLNYVIYFGLTFASP